MSVRLRSAVLFALAAPLCAQGLILQPDGPGPGQTPPPGQPTPPRALVHVVRTAIHGEIVDGVATTVIDQVFRNDGAREAEGTWILPLPRGAVADGFTMTVGGKEIRGESLDANQARNVYEAIVRQRRDPGLLEFAGEGLLRARIYPIPAQSEVGVTVRLRQVLEPLAGVYQWQWPLRSMQMGDAGTGPIALDVKIRSSAPLATVFSPFGGAEVRREGDRDATVTLEGSFAQLENLEVYYGLAQQEFGLHLLAHRPVGQDGYFAMLVSPPRALGGDAPQPRRCVQFVIDTSGSMQGAKIEQAKASLKAFLASLRPTDMFQVVTFASGVQTFFGAPVPADAQNLAAALQKVETLTAMGGTNISGALEQALRAEIPVGGDGPYLPQIVFVTDGEPTMGVTNPQQILELTKKADAQTMRLFALGVGDQIDVRLIDDLVLQHRGARDFVGNKEKIEAKVGALCQKLAQPALTDVVVRCDGIDVFDVQPTNTRDMFCGEQLQITGRYRGDGRKRVVIKGKQNGKEREYAFDVEFPAAAPEREFVQTLWARQQVAALLDGIRRNGQKPELLTELRNIATKYGIVTPFTSQLILEEGMRLHGGVPVSFDSNRWGTFADGRAVPTGSAVRGTGGPAGPATGGPGAPAPGSRGLSALPTAGGGFNNFGATRTGERAVAESKAAEARDDLYLGSVRRAQADVPGAKDRGGKVVPAEESERQVEPVRRVGGRTFLLVGEDLVQQGLPADWREKAVVVEAFGDAYFALLKADPKLKDVLALGDRVVFLDGERIVHVKPAAK
ncbi:MAG: hypothetical protein RL398_756 [Planctomycetota bacterium]|jgi:Ca-activated chloride channel family protein